MRICQSTLRDAEKPKCTQLDVRLGVLAASTRCCNNLCPVYNMIIHIQYFSKSYSNFPISNDQNDRRFTLLGEYEGWDHEAIRHTQRARQKQGQGREHNGTSMFSRLAKGTGPPNG